MATAHARAARRATERTIAKILRCDGCGAALSYVAEVGAPRCVFCAAVMRVEQPSDPLEVAERVLPFAVTPDAARAALRRWLGSRGFFRPSDLATASLEALKPTLWCAWLVGADALVSWTADSNAGSGRSSWAPHAGQTPMRFERLVIPASRGLTHPECVRLVPSYDVGALLPAASAHAGALVEQFDVQRSAARRHVVEAIERTAAARLVSENAIPGSSFRHVRVSALLRSMHTDRVALCAYVLAYRYKGHSYRAIVHGQDPRVTFGEAPLSIAKIAIVVAIVLGVIAAIVAVLATRG
jgi:hypothetical protein